MGVVVCGLTLGMNSLHIKRKLKLITLRNAALDNEIKAMRTERQPHSAPPPSLVK